MASMPTSIHATSNSGLRRGRGFTLIELALVLVILSVLLSFAAPRLLELTMVRREASAERLATLLGYLHDEASLRGETYRVTIDLDDATYRIRSVEPDPSSVETSEPVAPVTPLARDEILPEGVRVDSVETPDAFAQNGSIDLLFHPDGDAAAARITFIDESGGVSVLVLDGVTGRARVLDPSENSVRQP